MSLFAPYHRGNENCKQWTAPATPICPSRIRGASADSLERELVDLETKCATCRWWLFQKTDDVEDRRADDAIGYCRRFPPERRENGVGAWPITFSGDWCGEHRHREDAMH